MVQTAALSLWSHYLVHGWEETFRLLKQKLDVEGETSAYTVLGLEPGAPPIRQVDGDDPFSWSIDPSANHSEASQLSVERKPPAHASRLTRSAAVGAQGRTRPR